MPDGEPNFFSPHHHFDGIDVCKIIYHHGLAEGRRRRFLLINWQSQIRTTGKKSCWTLLATFPYLASTHVYAGFLRHISREATEEMGLEIVIIVFINNATLFRRRRALSVLLRNVVVNFAVGCCNRCRGRAPGVWLAGFLYRCTYVCMKNESAYYYILYYSPLIPTKIHDEFSCVWKLSGVKENLLAGIWSHAPPIKKFSRIQFRHLMVQIMNLFFFLVGNLSAASTFSPS